MNLSTVAEHSSKSISKFLISIRESFLDHIVGHRLTKYFLLSFRAQSNNITLHITNVTRDTTQFPVYNVGSYFFTILYMHLGTSKSIRQRSNELLGYCVFSIRVCDCFEETMPDLMKHNSNDLFIGVLLAFNKPKINSDDETNVNTHCIRIVFKSSRISQKRRANLCLILIG